MDHGVGRGLGSLARRQGAVVRVFGEISTSARVAEKAVRVPVDRFDRKSLVEQWVGTIEKLGGQKI